MDRDCDLVISPAADDFAALFPDELGLVNARVMAALHTAEIHLRGFDIPWSFETPIKNMPWSNFYQMTERKIFEPLFPELNASRASGDAVYDVMRALVADAIPALCFSRDRLEFYRQQDRWAQRHGLEHQDFSFEYAAHLNHFYLTFYAAIDQVAALVVHLYKMEVAERNIGATYKAFREQRKAHPAIDAVFSDSAFWEMYEIPQLIRQRAAHRGPVKPEALYFGDDDFTDEQVDEAAEKYGLLGDFMFMRDHDVPQFIVDHALTIAREKARRRLMGPPRRHNIFLKNGKKGLFYYPDPTGELRRFLDFFARVLAIVKPWGDTKERLWQPGMEARK
jgi:hypothetical protein